MTGNVRTPSKIEQALSGLCDIRRCLGADLLPFGAIHPSTRHKMAHEMPPTIEIASEFVTIR